MGRFVGWHTRLGETGLRLLVLHLLWILHTLRGGIVLGVFPATAAVHAVLRRDLMEGEGSRPGVWREFDRQWRASWGRANVIGLLLAAAWAVLLVEHQVLRGAGGQGLAGAVGALLWLAMAFLFVVTALVWVLEAHFDEGPLAVLRRAARLALGRPLLSLGAAVTLATVLCVYYVAPGLVPVLGVAGAALIVSAMVRRSGVLPAPPAERAEPAAISVAA